MLAGAAGATAWRAAGDNGKPVGTWQDAPEAARTPVSADQKFGSGQNASTQPGVTPATPAPAQPGAAATEQAAEPRTEKGTLAPPEPGTTERPIESGTANGRQRVGEQLRVSKLLGYLGGKPQKETFSYPGASYVKLHFSRMALLPGDYVTVTNADGTESYRYEATDKPADNDRWAMSVTGDTAVLEVHRGASDPLGLNSLAGGPGVDVDRVARGFSRTEQDRQPEKQVLAPGRTGREESVCGSDTSADAVCYRTSDPVAFTKTKAIARLLINGTELCTGWRVGPQNRMLTNNHCFTSSAQAYDTEVWFNYQCAKCGGYDVLQPTKVWGSQVIATDKTYDFTLFSVDKFDAVKKFGYLLLDTKRPAKGQELYVPQHPAGEPARIAGSLGEKAGNCAVVNPGYDGYATGSDVAYYCDTEGGSSGSPVLSRATNKVVALHHFGGCPNSGVRADLLAARLARYL
ncbi:trypsin-like peptidase domain-containing protein [Actinoplanes sp. LDG1-06]|uniref:Trypsin-like peptidase domain-containing protein n=1 Tax=Paractinoplanes ovalisporus TaxID=2810368 RepID=A0ABS2ABS8_9ACTN|nr:serine protease [Actinoplanes ovalisporus]MBM2617279.1 trypsin-like peptidase domain-containing protein [Actinoplanes ovalisporus]